MGKLQAVSLFLAACVLVAYWLLDTRDLGEPFPGATRSRPERVATRPPARPVTDPEVAEREEPTAAPIEIESSAIGGEPRRDEGSRGVETAPLTARTEPATSSRPGDPRRVIPFRPGPSSDTIALKEPTSGFLLEDAILQASGRTAFICFDHRGPFEGTTFRNVLILVEPGTLRFDRSYWAIRGYDMIDTRLEDVEITGFGRVTEVHDEGHAVYLNLAGSLTVEGSYLHHNGGQGLQLVNRPGESSLPVGPAAGTITIRNTRLHENGFNPDRGGFQLSIFGTGQQIVLEDVEIVAGFDERVWPEGGSRGGIVIEAEPWNPERTPPKPVWWHPDQTPKGWRPPFAQGRTELTRVTVRHRSPDRAIVQIKGCEELVVRDCTFLGGRVVLDDPTKPGRPSGRIDWAGNHGDAAVFHAGKRLGTAGEDFVIQAPGGGKSSSRR